MGITSNIELESDTYPNNIMKLCLLAIALVAGVVAEPESKPYYGYGGLYGGYGLGYGHYLGKRSADAESEADPYVVGYYPYGNGYALPHYGYGYHLLGKRSADAEPESKPYHGYGGLYGGYGHYLGKRSADAESKADPLVVGYYTY